MNQLMVNTNGATLQASNPVVESARKYLSFGIFVLGAVFIFSSIQLAYADDGHKRHKRKKSHVKVNDQLIEVQGAILSLQDQLDALVSRVDTVEERVVANEVAVSTLTSQILAMQSLIDSNLTDISAIQNEVVALQDQNSYLLSLIATNSGDIAALQAEFDANTSMITTLEQAILLVQSNVIDLGTSLQAQIDTNITMISSLQSEIDSINDSLAFKQNLVNGICDDGTAVTQIMPSGSVICGDITGGGGGGSGTGTSQLVTVRAFSEIFAAPGQQKQAVTECPVGFLVTGYGFIYAEGWGLNNLANTQPAFGYISARNNNTYTDSMFHVVACATIVPGV